MEYQQAKREGFYEMDNVAGQPLEYEQTWVGFTNNFIALFSNI